MNKPIGWNAMNTYGIWWHEFPHDEESPAAYNWSIIDNNTVDEDTMPPLWIPVNMARGFVHDALSLKGMNVDVDMSGDAVDCMSLYDTNGLCCNGHEWEARHDMNGETLYGHCENPKCSIEVGAEWHGISSFCHYHLEEWVEIVEDLKLK